MNTKRSKRWNGKIDTLTIDFLNDVLAQMATYGDRVQFGLTGTALRPNYQVTNTAGKSMAFDCNNHLLHPKADEFAVANVTTVFTLEQIKTAVAAGGFKKTGAARVTRVGGASNRGGTVAAKAKEAIDAGRYEYFKNNRQTLPHGIGEHSEEISSLMKQGMSAEEAFGDVVKRYF